MPDSYRLKPPRWPTASYAESLRTAFAHRNSRLSSIMDNLSIFISCLFLCLVAVEPRPATSFLFRQLLGGRTPIRAPAALCHLYSMPVVGSLSFLFRVLLCFPFFSFLVGASSFISSGAVVLHSEVCPVSFFCLHSFFPYLFLLFLSRSIPLHRIALRPSAYYFHGVELLPVPLGIGPLQ